MRFYAPRHPSKTRVRPHVMPCIEGDGTRCKKTPHPAGSKSVRNHGLVSKVGRCAGLWGVANLIVWRAPSIPGSAADRRDAGGFGARETCMSVRAAVQLPPGRAHGPTDKNFQGASAQTTLGARSCLPSGTKNTHPKEPSRQSGVAGSLVHLQRRNYYWLADGGKRHAI